MARRTASEVLSALMALKIQRARARRTGSTPGTIRSVVVATESLRVDL